MKSLDIDLERIAASDRDSARQMAIQTHDWTPRILAVVVICAWVFIQWHLLNSVIPDVMRELIARVLGTLDAALTLVLSYYFGSSHQHSPAPKE
jgi:protein-S-isoprenylcysteine O-methyltransferase Ste14